MMAKVFPNLMQKCQEKGYQFQIVDMRWGVRDEATDDHRTTDLCLREIELCKKISTGPCFMTLVSHKYGWFKEDKNSKPPKYVLLPISTHYDMGRDKDREKWREECERMQKIMLRSTGKPLESVTEAEIRCALLADQKTAERGIWFYRKFTNISDYYDNDEGKKKESRELLQKLKDDMRGVQGDKKKKDQSVIRLPEANCKKIKIRWDKKQGVNPAVKEHEQYLKEMCCGKTSVVAMAAREAWTKRKEKGAVILRFLGTTLRSSNVANLLSSIILQLKGITEEQVSEQDVRNLPTKLKDLVESFHKEIEEKASEDFPVTLLLDSLDQLNPENGALQLTWLPIKPPEYKLPEHVKVIVSTLPDNESFPRLKGMYPDGQKSNFCEVVEMETKDVKHLLEEWLKASGRQLQEDQKTRVLDAFKKCPEPLYMKLSFDTASKWRSYWPEKDTVLQETVEKSISQIFDDLEKMHGKLFVSRALGYLTVSRNGLAETELEDVLCCDEGAMKDVCTYWEPPHDNYRLPPLLLVRLKADMAHYLADREADGVCVFFWYHRQFIKVAEERYCKSKGMQLHEGLADYYTGAVAAGKPRPSQEASKRKGPTPRVSKPFPKRMLNQLPYHASMCKNKNLLKEYCLLNYTFLKDKLNESGIRQQLLASPGGQLVSYIWCKDVDVVTGLTGLAVSCGKPQHGGSSGKGTETEKPKIRHEWTVEDTQRYARKQICFCSFQRSTMVVFGHDEGAANIRVTLYNAKREIITVTTDGRDLKIYSVDDGKVKNIVKQSGQDPREISDLLEEQLFRDEDAETLERCLLLDGTNILLIYKEGVLGLFDKVKNKIHFWQGVFPENPRIYLDDDSKFFLTHTNWKVRVWKKTREADQFAELATFSLEDQLDGLLLLPHHGTQFLAATSISPNPIVFTIHGLKESSTGTTSKLRFLNEKPKESGVPGNSVVTLDLATDEGADDENDPDSSGDESLPVVN
nr:hypothetical protein BaRGS_007666 [Batillaria attramentaria]